MRRKQRDSRWKLASRAPTEPRIRGVRGLKLLGDSPELVEHFFLISVGNFCPRATRRFECPPVNLAEKLSTFSDYWAPRVVTEFNGHDAQDGELLEAWKLVDVCFRPKN